MMKIQHEEQLKKVAGNSAALSSGVNVEEITMIDGVLKFSDEMIRNIMTAEIFMLRIDEKLSLAVSFFYQ